MRVIKVRASAFETKMSSGTLTLSGRNHLEVTKALPQLKDRHR
jgi:hypothetical protein